MIRRIGALTTMRQTFHEKRRRLESERGTRAQLALQTAETELRTAFAEYYQLPNWVFDRQKRAEAEVAQKLDIKQSQGDYEVYLATTESHLLESVSEALGKPDSERGWTKPNILNALAKQHVEIKDMKAAHGRNMQELVTKNQGSASESTQMQKRVTILIEQKKEMGRCCKGIVIEERCARRANSEVSKNYENLNRTVPRLD
jgi:hypothetical protein